jgi:hypothetical protein
MQTEITLQNYIDLLKKLQIESGYAHQKTYGCVTEYKYPKWNPSYFFKVDWTYRITGKGKPVLSYDETKSKSPLELIGVSLQTSQQRI